MNDKHRNNKGENAMTENFHPRGPSGRETNGTGGKRRSPVRTVFSLAFSGLCRPCRIVCSILLSAVCFALFGLFVSAALYGEGDFFRETLTESGYPSVTLSREYRTRGKTFYPNGVPETRNVSAQTLFTPENLQEIEARTGCETVGAYENVYGYPDNIGYNTDVLFNAMPGAFADGRDCGAWKDRLLCGRMPGESGGEICISSYTARSLQHFGLRNPETGELYFPLYYFESLLGKPLRFNGFATLTISGVYDCGPRPARYDCLLDDFISDEKEIRLHSALRSECASGTWTLAFLDGESLERAKAGIASQNDILPDFTFPTEIYDPYTYEIYSVDAGQWLPQAPHSPVLYFGDTLPADDEILLESRLLASLFYNAATNKIFALRASAPQASEEMEAEFFNGRTDLGIPVSDIIGMGLGEYTDPETDEPLPFAERKRLFSFAEDFAEKWDLLPLTVSVNIGEEERTVLVRGAFCDEFYQSALKVCFGRELYLSALRPAWRETWGSTAYIPEKTAAYSYAVLNYDGSAQTAEKIYSLLDRYGEDDTAILASGALRSSTEQTTQTVGLLKRIFLCAALVSGILSALLLYRTIAADVSRKKAEILSLRAAGMRRTVSFAFLTESLFILIPAVALSAACDIVVCGLLNGALDFPSAAAFSFLPLPLAAVAVAALAVGAFVSFLALRLRA